MVEAEFTKKKSEKPGFMTFAIFYQKIDRNFTAVSSGTCSESIGANFQEIIHISHRFSATVVGITDFFYGSFWDPTPALGFPGANTINHPFLADGCWCAHHGFVVFNNSLVRHILSRCCHLLCWHGNTFHITGTFWGTSGFPSQICSNVESRCWLYSSPEQTVEQTFDFSVIWDAMTLTLYHCYGNPYAIMPGAGPGVI